MQTGDTGRRCSDFFKLFYRENKDAVKIWRLRILVNCYTLEIEYAATKYPNNYANIFANALNTMAGHKYQQHKIHTTRIRKKRTIRNRED